MIPSFLKKLLFSRQINFSKGTFEILGGRVVVFNAKGFIKLQKNLKELGKEGLVEEIGYDQGCRAGERVKDFEKMKKTMLNLLLDETSILGYGQLDLKELDFEKGAIIHVTNSAFAKSYLDLYGQSEEPVCHFLKGLIRGVGEKLVEGEKEMECEETKCRAMGDRYCEFKIEPKKKD